MGLLNIFRKAKEEFKESSTTVSMSDGKDKTKEINVSITESTLDKDPEKEEFDKIAPKISKETLKKIKKIERKLERKINKKLKENGEYKFKDELGFCHSYWDVKKEILKNEFGIVWFSPTEEIPGVFYD